MHKCGLVLPLLTFGFCSVLQAYRWSSTVEDNAHVRACVDGNVSFPWSVVTEGKEEKILDIDWLFQEPGKGNVSFATYVDGTFLTIKDRFTFIPNAGLFLQGAQSHDAGRYYVIVNLHDPKCRLTSAQRMVTLTVAADRPPATQDGALHVTLRDAERDDVTEDWTLELHCGVFVYFGDPPADVVWTTPSGEVMNSSYEDNGTFVLSVSSPVQGGIYTCRVPPSSPAARCLTATSPLNAAAQLYVDHKDVRLSFCEARQRELEQVNKDQAMQILQQNETMADMVTVNKDQAMQISQQNETMADVVTVNKDQAMQILQQNETMADVVTVNKDQAMQISQQNETIEELRADLLNLTTQFSAPTKTVNDVERRSAANCVDWLKLDPCSGIRTVYISGEPITVYCDQTTDNGGWIVFQRRQDASVDFYRNWADYRSGFGDPEGNFWLGLDALHSLTTSRRYQLRVDLKNWDGTRGYATYSGFYVEDSDNNFRLHYDSFTGGNAGDSLYLQRGQQFSTKDRDHDPLSSMNCAQLFHGAWWYKDCHASNLNADYKTSSSAPNQDGMNWKTFGGFKYSMKFTEMKIRPT